jgi:arylsulfatase A-like enzyme
MVSATTSRRPLARLWVSILLCVGVVGCGPNERPAPSPNGHNILFIVVDTLRADHLESYGYALKNSSRLYMFGKNSVVFDNAYAQSAWTKPSVASLLTSLEPQEHGIRDWEHQLTDDRLTLAEVLRDAGYDTEAYVGHHALQPKFNNFHQGFDVYDLSAFEHWGSPHDIASADRLTDLAIQSIQKERENPYFMWVHYFDPHDTYLNHQRFDYGPRDVHRYDSEIAYTDFHLGRLFSFLHDNKHFKDTIVVVTADHGEEFRDHGHLRHTHQMYDEVIRVPLMIRAPGVPAGRVKEGVAGIDVAPTMLGLAGIGSPEPFQGRSLPVVDGAFQLDPAHPIYAETRREVDRQAVIVDGWKLIQDKKKKKKKKSFQLFDLEMDPKERVNLYEKSPEMAESLRSRLAEHYDKPLAAAPAMAPDEEFTELLEQLGYLDGEEEAGQGE